LVNLEKSQVDSLKLQAKDYLAKDSLFLVLMQELDRVGTIHLARKSLDMEDIRWAKAVLFTNDILKKKVKFLSEGMVEQARQIGRSKEEVK